MKALGIGLIALGVAATTGAILVTFFADPRDDWFPDVLVFGWVVGISAFMWGAIAATGEGRNRVLLGIAIAVTGVSLLYGVIWLHS